MQQGVQPVPYGPAQPVPYGQPAPAQPPTTPTPPPSTAGGDIIYLKNGGILRGTIIDAIPNAQARIQLATGEIATVPWPEINRIEHSTSPSAPAPTTPSTTTPAKPTTPPPGKPSATAYVHLEAPDGARLQVLDDGWQDVCTAPCDRPLPLEKEYRISGSGIKDSSSFGIRAQNGQHVTITVNAASTGWFIFGAIAAPVGLVVGYLGLIIGVVATAADSVSGPQTGPAAGVAATGWTMFGVGVVMVVGGIVLLVTNWKTGTDQQVSTPTQGKLVPLDAWKRLPVWNQPTPEQKATPLSTSIPIFSGSF
jgi:hypothetical protein